MTLEETWMEDSENTERLTVTEYNIATSANDFNSATLASYMDSGVIKLPFFQRHYTWDKSRASKLIESIILGLPVPQIFLYEQKKNDFLILDGQQRLLSIFFFIKKRFPKKDALSLIRESFLKRGKLTPDILAEDQLFENFNLKLNKSQEGKDNKLHNLNYDTLDEYKLSFDLRPTRCIILKQNEPKDDDSSMYEIFDRLNTGGINLTPQEIRANLYHSTFYKVLYEWNKNKAWRRLLKNQNVDYKMRDIELLLRAFALLIDKQSYKPSMVSFLDGFSRKARAFDAETVSKYDIVYTKFFDTNPDLPVDFLTKGNKLSIALFESIFIYACENSLENPTSIPPLKIKEENVKALAQDGEFMGYLQEGTTKADNIKARLKRAKEILSQP